jgi:hypothetical protein
MALALLFAAGAPAQAQLAKSGKFAGTVGWNLRAEIYSLGENYTYIVGSNRGPFLNSAGGGFMHQASQICAWSNDSRNGTEIISGVCTLTDPEGDKAFFNFQRKAPAGDASVPGTFTFTDGTGKYKGIQGKATFRASVVNFRTSPAGDHLYAECEGISLWEGEYKLP